jgi:hypothetical protein
MNTLLEELVKLVPPPAEPRNAQGDWDQIQQNLGLVLPADYKEYVELYGSGVLCSFFSIHSPFALERQYGVSTRQAWSARAEIFRDWGEETHQEVPFPIYPEPTGLLPWGTYGDVDVLGWRTGVVPDRWFIVYLDHWDGFFELREMGFLRFLVAAIKGEVPLPDNVFGKDILLAEPRRFRPYD